MVETALHIPVIAGCAGFAAGLAAGWQPSAGSRRLPAAMAGALAFAAIAARYGPTPECAELLGFAWILLSLALADIESRVIPDWCIVSALLVRIAYLMVEQAAGGNALGALADSAIGFAVLGGGSLAAACIGDRLLGRESLGGGDVKLFAVAGFYFGWERGLALVFIACLLGLATSAVFARGKDRTFPFGPAIAVACVATMLLVVS